jgi:catechol 2,3-dioxygenase-like lactoylglutathione lyase family enzyme
MMQAMTADSHMLPADAHQERQTTPTIRETAMAIEYNHTIVWSRDAKASAKFLAEILGLPEPTNIYIFEVVTTANGVNVDFDNKEGKISTQHHAFLVSEAEFDDIFRRIKARELEYWADPSCTEPGEINHNEGGRGLYFKDPSDHLLEILTRPYGSGGRQA